MDPELLWCTGILKVLSFLDVSLYEVLRVCLLHEPAFLPATMWCSMVMGFGMKGVKMLRQLSYVSIVTVWEVVWWRLSPVVTVTFTQTVWTVE